MSSLTFLDDGNVLWLMVTKRGTPAAWSGATDYKLGDTVVPRFPQLGQEQIMFQCVGFIGSTGVSAPAFPTVIGSKYVDGGLEFLTQDQSSSPDTLTNQQYYQITEHLTVS